MQDEFTIDAPDGAPVPASMNLQVDGITFPFPGVDAVITEAVQLQYQITQPGAVAVREHVDLHDPEGATQIYDEIMITTGEGQFMPHVPISVTLRLSVDAEILDRLGLNELLAGPGMSLYIGDFFNTVSFSTTGPVWNLPEGASIISDITPGNRFTIPEPATIALLGIGVSVLRVRRKRISCC
jgi:hypothetical protein